MTRNWLSEFVLRFWTHIFVISTGFAALMHSTWTLSTAFGGMEPAVQFSQAWWSWVIPGFAIAFSFDVGQIAISVDLRRGERTTPKYVAFVVVAFSTYYLQWVYMAAHIPLIAFGPGVAPEAIGAATFLRNLVLWIVPALLPIATTLYTFSYAKPKRMAQNASRSAVYARTANGSANPEQMPALPTPRRAALPEPTMAAMIIAVCPDCGKEWPCETERQVINKLNAHKRWCSANVHSNGREHGNDD